MVKETKKKVIWTMQPTGKKSNFLQNTRNGISNNAECSVQSNTTLPVYSNCHVSAVYYLSQIQIVCTLIRIT